MKKLENVKQHRRMDDWTLPWVTTLLMGYTGSFDGRITLIRFIVFVAFTVAFGMIWYVKTMTHRIVFAVVIAAVVFLIKFILYILNVLVDRSIEVSSSSGVEMGTSVVARPPNIPSTLWDRRFQYISKPVMTDDDVVHLIQMGFEPDVVFEFYNIINERKNELLQEQVSGNRDSSSPSEGETFVKFGGRVWALPFNRIGINYCFHENMSLMYVFVATILTGLMAFFSTFILQSYSVGVFIWCAIVAGSMVYSTLHPPEVDPYSTTRGDIYNGVTRVFWILCISGIWKLSEFIAKEYGSTYYDYFDLTVNWVAVFDGVSATCKWLLCLFPVWFYTIFGHPVTMVLWTLEWVSRYMFGLAGAASIWHAILQFVRSGVTVGVFYLFACMDNKLYRAFGVLVATFMLQLPLDITVQLKKDYQWVKGIVSVTIISIVAFGAYMMGSIMKSEVSVYIAFGFVAVFDFAWPYLYSNNGYWIFHFRVFDAQLKFVQVLRLCTPAVIAPMLLGSILTSDSSIPLVLAAFVVIHVINKAFTEPHVLALALLITTLGIHYEMKGMNVCVILMISLIVSRKWFSVWPIIDFYMRARQMWIDPDDVEYIGPLVTRALCTSLSLVPLPDRTLSFAAFLWSLLTGAPFFSPGLIQYFLFLSSPRPNCFWDSNNGQNMDIAVNFSASITEHPVETPVYTSAASALAASFGSLLRSGRLGVVDSNDIFLFTTDTLACFVHVIGHEPHAVRFQIRGLEYNNETTCHRFELTSLKKNIEEYELFPNLEISSVYRATNWQLRALEVPLWSYDVNNYHLENVFTGIPQEDIAKWALLSFAWVIAHRPNFSKLLELIQCPESRTIPEMLSEALRKFGFECEESAVKKLATLWRCIAKRLSVGVVEGGMRLNLEFLSEFFSDNISAAKDDQWFWDNHILMEEVAEPTISEITLTLAVVSMGLAPELDDLDEIPGFYEDTHNEYLCAPMKSPEFADAFKEEKLSLVTMVDDKQGSTKLLFFRLQTTNWNIFAIQRESVRCYWNSEAKTQLFYLVDEAERQSIQNEAMWIHNLIVQSCNIPLGYPALVSPVLTSYAVPPSFETF